MTTSREHFIGTLQRPNGRPENIDLVVKKRANLTRAEKAAGVEWVDSRYEPGNVKRYGAVGDGVADDTAAIRLALSVAESAGGGDVYFPSGTYIVSSSDTPAYCLRVPANTHLRGQSRFNTIITRTVANVDEASILIVNDDCDTATVYNAAGGITISELTIRDSLTTERTATTGDLIGLGHCDKAIVRDCIFGKHAQHCVDIAGSRDVKVLDCIEDNDNGLTGYAANASVQVDRAVTNAFIGINGDNTDSRDILISGNTFRSTNTNEILHIGHNGGTAHNVTITDNYLYGTARSFSKLIRCDTDETSIDGLVISDNILECTTANNSAINIVCNGNDSESIKNITITGNIIKGTAGTGIYVGGTSSFTQSTFPDFRNITITGNTVDIDWNSSTVQQRGIIVSLCDNVLVEGNTVNVTKASDNNDMYGIFLLSCLSAVARGNMVKTALTTSYTGTNISAAIGLSRYGSMLTTTSFTMEASGNFVDVSAFRYGLAATAMDSLGIDKPRFSGNTFLGALTNGDDHIRETLVASDGTNGLMDVDFGSGTFTQSVAVDTTYSVSPGLTKTTTTGATVSPSTIEVTYSPGAIGTMATTSEHLLTNQADIGIHVQNYDATAGTFDVVTGSTGTQLSIVQGGADTTQTGGHIRCRFGI